MTQALLDEIARLNTRQDELLATIARIANETPFPDEIAGWEAQRAAMVAEIGTLRSQLREKDLACQNLTPVEIAVLRGVIAEIKEFGMAADECSEHRVGRTHRAAALAVLDKLVELEQLRASKLTGDDLASLRWLVADVSERYVDARPSLRRPLNKALAVLDKLVGGTGGG